MQTLCLVTKGSSQRCQALHFGVLQAKWQIMVYPCRFWDYNVIADVLMACIILHNMVIKDQENLVLELTIKLPNNIQMNKGLTFVKYIED
jgi:hypothetical protein